MVTDRQPGSWLMNPEEFLLFKLLIINLSGMGEVHHKEVMYIHVVYLKSKCDDVRHYYIISGYLWPCYTTLSK